MELLTIVEAAQRLKIGRTTFIEKVLPELRVARAGRRVLIPAEEIDRWAREGLVPFAPEPAAR